MIDAGEIRGLCDWLVGPRIEAMRRYLATGRLEPGELQRRLATAERRMPASWREALDAARKSLADGEEPGSGDGAGTAGDREAIFELLAAMGGLGTVPDAAAPDPPPLISVIMPCWNRASLVGEAIGSVLAQSWHHWELIVVDDGSTDGSEAFVTGFASDPRIRCIHQPHAGVSAARNRGLAAARGEIIAYLDSDDVWFPEYLAALAHAFAAEPDLATAYGAVAYQARTPGKYQVQFRDFDRSALLVANFISMIAFAHRRHLVERYGGFDTGLPRLVDWDLILRYTVDRAPKSLPVLAAWVRTGDWASVSSTESISYSGLLVRRKRTRPIARPLRVLYAIAHDAHAGGGDIEAEIGFLRRCGVELHLWSEAGTAAPRSWDGTVHGRSLAEVSDALRPEIVHVRSRALAEAHLGLVRDLKLPVTIRATALDCPPTVVQSLAGLAQVRQIFLPNQVVAPEACGDKLRPMPVAFDARLFVPCQGKESRLVVTLAASGPAASLDLVPPLARRLPGWRFVLAAPARADGQPGFDEVLQLNESLGRPADIRLGLQRNEIARLLGEASICLHAQRLREGPGDGAAAIGAAMATGAYVIARRCAEAEWYVRRVGALYEDADEAAALIAATESWGAAEWALAWRRSVDRAFRQFADEVVLPPLLDAWFSIVGER